MQSHDSVHFPCKLGMYLIGVSEFILIVLMTQFSIMMINSPPVFAPWTQTDDSPLDKGWTCLLQVLQAAVDETAPMHALRQHVSLLPIEHTNLHKIDMHVLAPCRHARGTALLTTDATAWMDI